MEEKLPTMKDIAREANVSIATVSAVVNQSKHVSPELENRVKKAIKELGYRPNRIARSLKMKESKLIGVTVTEITNPFYPLMLKGVEEKAMEEGYRLLLSTTEDDEEKEYKLVQSMIDQGVDGMVLATIDNENSRVLKLLEEENVKYVLINRSPSNVVLSSVCPDSYKVGVIATNYLIQLGHRNIGFVGGERQNSFLRERGFRDTMVLNKLSVNEEWILDGMYDVESSHLATKKLIATGKVPSALFAANDLMAFGVVKAFLEEGIRVPEDVSVIGSDNIPFTEDFRVPLTTVDVGKFEMGFFGCQFLLDALSKGADGTPRERKLIEPQLIVRESTASADD